MMTFGPLLRVSHSSPPKQLRKNHLRGGFFVYNKIKRDIRGKVGDPLSMGVAMLLPFLICDIIGLILVTARFRQRRIIL